MMLMILSMLCGALLGMRFKVFILFPAIPVCLGLNADIAAAHGSGLWPTLLAIALSLTGLQLGFLAGLVTRYAMAASRAPRSHSLTGDTIHERPREFPARSAPRSVCAARQT
jgi:hypothetical protein